MHRAPMVAVLASVLAASGCAGKMPPDLKSAGVRPAFSYAVTDNPTPYSQCLEALAHLDVKATRLPVFSVGEISDKTGQIDPDNNSHALSQGVSEMVISALQKTRKVHQVERLDLRIPLAEVKLAEQKKLSRSEADYGKLPASDFIIVGALTELNYNIVSGGAQVFVNGIGGGGRTVIINVALDLRVIDARTFQIRYVSSLQKQIFGYEVEANVFNFFGNTLVELDAGAIRNEPLQLGVRSVAEMAVNQIMTDFLGLPAGKDCSLVKNDHMASYLKKQSKTDVKAEAYPKPKPASQPKA
ncbi:MAG: curli production assembly/transport component CsgG [Alphaproteobacteria bacterium]|nr:curli production assembly/transport component CsgG [Alphaproteobacteria bacterium]MBU0804737.1 curli production assembly/transport component CsgG [Alphaproteobacteria bacterium]MBU0873197.1 curli production assembly/transport component CsgG [Alphaproteobacteria bacterium]MBU1403322.1 curli production assembly/transport component CsgG [Alphaproteobacteria bacterium]MBU1589658.1 curli production assembly/transport component CsgG [Alphaproteobacteria bacterium]